MQTNGIYILTQWNFSFIITTHRPQLFDIRRTAQVPCQTATSLGLIQPIDNIAPQVKMLDSDW